MLNLLKKRPTELLPADIAPSLSFDARDFIPQFTHLDAHTLVTKNGEVMQTIRIRQNRHGLDYELHNSANATLRDSIRKGIMQNIPSDNVSVWIHTLRKRRNVSFEANYQNNFAKYVHERWKDQHGWSHQYYNEIYITLLFEGQTSNMTDKLLMKEGFSTKRNRIARNTYLHSAASELSLMMDAIIDDLSDNYIVHKLQVTERLPEGDDESLPKENIFYSEPMEFLSYLLNLRDEQVPLPDADISAALQSTDIIFGFNAMETKDDDGKKRFGAVLSLKEYREIPAGTVDMLLQAPMELIISQAFHFIPADKALKEYREQKEIFEMSGDEYSIAASGLKAILGANKKHPTDYGSQQTSITVLVDELKLLDDDIEKLLQAFSAIGLVCIREDIRLEEVFWSILPGNFNFLRRKSTIPTMYIAGFAKLNRFPSGQNSNMFWQQNIALLPTLVNSPYFFNFHRQDNGHTLWIDFNSFQDRIAHRSLSFLLTQAEKLHPHIYYLDHAESGFLWFDKLGAPYKRLHTNKSKASMSLNPFSLAPDPRNIAFLAAWCSELIGATQAEREQLKSGIEQFYHTSQTPHFPAFVAFLSLSHPNLASRFSPWLSPGEFGGLFSGGEDNFTTGGDYIGVDLTETRASPANAVAALAYLLHRIILSLDGHPTIIVLQHALPILQQPFFASRLSSLLEMLKENNAMLVANVPFSPGVATNPAFSELAAQCASTILSPDDLNIEYARLLPSVITKEDQELLWKMKRNKGDFLLKQEDETVALRINLDAIPDVAAIYENDIKTLISAGGTFATRPKQEKT